MRCWYGYLCGVRGRCVTCDLSDATATPSSDDSLKSAIVHLSVVGFTQAVLENRLWNDCFDLLNYFLTVYK